MRIRRASSQRGIALMLVMLVVLALMVIAGSFAYSIKVETKLALNTQSEAEMEWLGRAGVEMARWILFMQKRIPKEAGYDSLNQFWAGGPGPVDELESAQNPFLGMSLKNIPCGPGSFSLEIVDEERKINVNTVPLPVLQRALSMSGIDAMEAQMLNDAIQDWRDRDDLPRMGGGAESSSYLDLNPPYEAKNGQIDDIRELLKIKGVTPEMYFGAPPPLPRGPRNRFAPPSQVVPLAKLFCAQGQRVNVNTAPPEVLSVLFGVEPDRVRDTVIRARSGDDGADGTPDDRPFRDPGVIMGLLGLTGAGGQSSPNPQVVPGVAGLLTAQSVTFEVRVDAQLGSARRRFIALLRRTQSPEPITVYFRRE